MTPEQIKEYFSKDQVYLFEGTKEELQSLMVSIHNSYNYIIDQYKIYFICENAISDSRVTLI